jgi:hypothetical protein
MDTDLIIPSECLPFIRWQRSRLWEESYPDPQGAIAEYARWVGEDYKSMAPHLPAGVGSILGIGCGMAGLECLLARRYPTATLSLLDGDGERVTAGYNATSEAYNSRRHTELLLAANGVKVSRWYDVNTKERLEADLIVSLASWGFHYPLATYDAHGLVIADLRRLREKMRGKVIFNARKYARCMFRL